MAEKQIWFYLYTSCKKLYECIYEYVWWQSIAIKCVSPGHIIYYVHYVSYVMQYCNLCKGILYTEINRIVFFFWNLYCMMAHCEKYGDIRYVHCIKSMSQQCQIMRLRRFKCYRIDYMYKTLQYHIFSVRSCKASAMYCLMCVVYDLLLWNILRAEIECVLHIKDLYRLLYIYMYIAN